MPFLQAPIRDIGRPYWITCACRSGFIAHATRPHARHLAVDAIVASM